MTTYIVRCKQCGVEFEPDRRAIVQGTWQTCPACRPADDLARIPEVRV